MRWAAKRGGAARPAPKKRPSPPRAIQAGQNLPTGRPEEDWPPWGAGSHTQWATVGVDLRRAAPRKIGPLGGQEATRSGRPWG